MYFPEDNCPFYRVTVFSNYSPNNVPEGGPYFSLMTEISESHKKPVNQSTLVDEVIEGLRATKLISNEEIVSRWSFRTEYGYPTPSLKRDEILKTVIPVLDAQNIFSRGRFGGWKYEVSNQDHSFMQGVEWVDKIIEAKPERTFQL
jgi:protoporphyrinogen oxidase